MKEYQEGKKIESSKWEVAESKHLKIFTLSVLTSESTFSFHESEIKSKYFLIYSSVFSSESEWYNRTDTTEQTDIRPAQPS